METNKISDVESNIQSIRDTIALIKGWTLEEHRGCDCHKLMWYEPSGEVVAVHYFYGKDYPTDLNAAKILLYEMKRYFFRISIMVNDYDDNVIVQCDYRCGHDEKIMPIVGNGVTIELAICDAYIKWSKSKDKS